MVLLHCMDGTGDKITMTIETKSLGDFVHAIVKMVSSQLQAFPILYVVKCRRRPGHKKCNEPIIASIDPESESIEYVCPKCGDKGSISNWRNPTPSMWSEISIN
jgi:hypothetical protein